MSLITITNLSVCYGSKTVLQDIDLSVEPAEIVTIVGPNGSGKTSLFRAIIGTAPISNGNVEIMSDLKIGYVPQRLNIDHTLPITVERFLRLNNKPEENSYYEALTNAETDGLLKLQMSDLSSGQFQRVLLTRALINQPEILLLDEATQGLDQPGSATFYRTIEGLRRNTGCAVLMISHDLHVVMSTSDRVICLNGHVCCAGAPETVASSPEYKALFGADTEGTLALYRHHHDHSHDSRNEGS